MEELLTLLEAARWAPSARNYQPWRFLYALRHDSFWQSYLALMNDAYRRWVQKAGALLVVLSKTTGENGVESRTHEFDTGGACENISLQATLLGLSTHIIQSFDLKAAREVLGIPAVFGVEYIIAIGRPGNAEELSAELRSREYPKQRCALSEITFAGKFPANGEQR